MMQVTFIPKKNAPIQAKPICMYVDTNNSQTDENIASDNLVSNPLGSYYKIMSVTKIEVLKP